MAPVLLVEDITLGTAICAFNCTNMHTGITTAPADQAMRLGATSTRNYFFKSHLREVPKTIVCRELKCEVTALLTCI